MPDDNVMDRLLRETMAADVPQLSPGFDARLMRRVRPPRLTTMGRVVIAVYIVFAVVTAAWVMRGLPLEWIATAVAIGVPAAAGAGVYGRRVAGVQ
jgi:hypothetical protein